MEPQNSGLARRIFFKRSLPVLVQAVTWLLLCAAAIGAFESGPTSVATEGQAVQMDNRRVGMSAADMALAQRVVQQLRQQLPGIQDVQVTRPGTIYVTAVRGNIMLNGLAVDQNVRDQATQIAKAVSGVQNVTNTLYLTGEATPGSSALGYAPPPQAAPPRQGQGQALYSVPGFTWPPPAPSGMEVVPQRFFMKPSGPPRYLGDVDEMICSALDSCGYFEKRYYAAPDGFIVATRVERIDPDGKPSAERFEESPAPFRSGSFGDYLRALFLSKPGQYRIILFVVTSRAFSPSDVIADKTQAEAWFVHGGNTLPPAVARLECSREHRCTAMVYEFEQVNPRELARLRLPGHLQARDHLIAAGLWRIIGGQR